MQRVDKICNLIEMAYTVEAPISVSPVIVGVAPVDLPPAQIEIPTLLPLRIVGNSIDVDVNVHKLGEDQKISKAYEEDCFKQAVSELQDGEIAYGPHLLNAAFSTTLRVEHISVPDGLVCAFDKSPLPMESSGVPFDVPKPFLRVVRIIEARTGDINGRYKLAGFANLMDEMHGNPFRFAMTINNILRGRGEQFIPVVIVAPPDRSVRVTFYSPKVQPAAHGPSRQRQIADSRFTNVEYLTVPQTVKRGHAS